MMPHWTQEGYLVVILQKVKILPGERGSVERFIAYHNADIDALTAERDELQRRLDEVVASLKPGPEPMRYVLGDQKVDHHPTTRLYARALTIAEGRDNG